MKLHSMAVLTVCCFLITPWNPRPEMKRVSFVERYKTERPRNVKSLQMIANATAVEDLLPVITVRALQGDKIVDSVLVVSPNDQVPPTLYLLFENSDQYEAFAFTDLTSVYEDTSSRLARFMPAR